MRSIRATFGHQPVLDDETADRLLAGRLASDDAPPDFAAVAQLVARLGAPAHASERSGDDVVAAMTRRLAGDGSAPTLRRTTTNRRRLVQTAAAGAVAALGAFGGLAAANALPGAAQSIASEMLGKVGVDVPSPDTHAGSHSAGAGGSATHPSAPDAASQGKGADVSSLATGTDATGVDKGAVISTEASGGRSHAGTAGTGDGQAPSGVPPVSSTPPASVPPVSVPPSADQGLSHRP